MATSTAAFERFRFSFFEDPYSARDGLATAALAELEAEERTQAETMLLDYLPDTRGVIGLGVLRSFRSRLPLMSLFEAECRYRDEARNSADGFWASDQLVYLAKALWEISPDPRWLEAMLDVLACGQDSTQRGTAVQALYGVGDQAAAQALVKALDDDDSLVRYHAARALLALIGLAAEPNDSDHMMYRLMADDSARRESGKRDVLAAIEAQRNPVRLPDDPGQQQP